jgi:predicted transposase YdaD
MKTDKLFHRIFLSQPELIAELLSGIPVGCEFEYSAPVVKEKEVRLDGGWMHRLYLEDLLPLTNLGPTLSLLRLLVVPNENVGADAQAILAAANEAEFLRVLDLVEAILVSKIPSLSIEEIKAMLDLQDVRLSETQFFKEVFQQGEDRGEQKGEANSALRLLTRRCGELPIAQQTLIRSLSIAQLESLGDALLDFGGMADLEDWLRANVGE